MAITVTQLRAFLAVVRGGSVTAAADELVVTQPSVSAAVASLGRELDCELLERAGRGIRPTAAGAAFAPYAADILGLLEQGRRAAREAGDGAGRRLRIAAVTTAAESFVPTLMRAFADEHPEIELTLDVGNRQQVLDRVLDHSVDVAISGRPPTDDRLTAEPLMINEIVCITAPDDPLAAGEPVAPAAMPERAWLLREPGSGTREPEPGVPRGSRCEPRDADARLKRRDQAGREGGARGVAALARHGRGRARGRAAGRAAADRPATGAALVRAALRGRADARAGHARSSRSSSHR